MYIGCLSIGGVRMNHCRLLYGVILWNTLYETAKLHHFVYFLGSATLRNKMKWKPCHLLNLFFLSSPYLCSTLPLCSPFSSCRGSNWIGQSLPFGGAGLPGCCPVGHVVPLPWFQGQSNCGHDKLNRLGASKIDCLFRTSWNGLNHPDSWGFFLFDLWVLLTQPKIESSPRAAKKTQGICGELYYMGLILHIQLANMILNLRSNTLCNRNIIWCRTIDHIWSN